jgi:hypothetical protein
MLNEYPEILTVSETMKILRFGKNKIYTMIHEKQIKSFGSPIRVLKESVLEYINKSISA